MCAQCPLPYESVDSIGCYLYEKPFILTVEPVEEKTIFQLMFDFGTIFRFEKCYRETRDI